MLHLIQFQSNDEKKIALLEKDGTAIIINGYTNLLDLFLDCFNTSVSVNSIINSSLSLDTVLYHDLFHNQLLSLPITPKIGDHLLIGGTGLTHKKRLQTRKKAEGTQNQSSDSLSIYEDGVKNGKPENGQVGATPEWFFKGSQNALKTTGQVVTLPAHDSGSGEEAELIVVYYILPTGVPLRLGFCLGNEVNDHVLEKKNHFYIAQCKLRQCSASAEIIISDKLFPSVHGDVYLKRNDETVWENNFCTGASNMNHSLENIEHHIFKHNTLFSPGSVYYHFLGADQISYQAGFTLQENDQVIIQAFPFYQALINNFIKAKINSPIKVETLAL